MWASAEISRYFVRVEKLDADAVNSLYPLFDMCDVILL
jgi:hypothetical protein